MLVRLCTCAKGCSCRDRCKYRYICRLGGLLARGGRRLERIRLVLRSRLKSRNRVYAEHNLHTQDGLLRLLYIHGAMPVYYSSGFSSKQFKNSSNDFAIIIEFFLKLAFLDIFSLHTSLT